MATAKEPGGFYYTAAGVAVDAEGKEIKGAPKPEPDTPPEKQPGAIGSVNTPEERMANAIASALKPAAVARPAPPAPRSRGGKSGGRKPAKAK